MVTTIRYNGLICINRSTRLRWLVRRRPRPCHTSNAKISSSHTPVFRILADTLSRYRSLQIADCWCTIRQKPSPGSESKR